MTVNEILCLQNAYNLFSLIPSSAYTENESSYVGYVKTLGIFLNTSKHIHTLLLLDKKVISGIF